MKAVHLPLLFTLLCFKSSAQQRELKLDLHIDTCSFYKTVLNTEDTVFSIRFTNSSSIIPLLKKNDIEIGIKLYANSIIEDNDTTTIVRYIFYNKETGKWFKISESEYIPLSGLGNARSLNVGSDQPVSHFYLRYYFALDYDSVRKIK